MPQDFVKNGEAWKKLNPTWEVITWTEPTFVIVNECLYKRPPRHLGPVDQLRYRSDLLRLEILHQYGGLYVDTDIEPLRPIESLVAGHDALVAFSPNKWKGHSVATNALMWAVPRHDWIKRCIIKMPMSIRMFPNAFLARITGPHHINRCLTDDVHVLPAETVFPTTLAQLGSAYTFHSWANRTGLTKEALV